MMPAADSADLFPSESIPPDEGSLPDLDSGDSEQSGVRLRTPPPPGPRDWRASLLTKLVKNPITHEVREVTRSCQPNISLILTHHELWTGLLVFDEFAGCVVKTRTPPWPDHETAVRSKGDRPDREWSDSDTAQLINWLDREEHIQTGAIIADAGVGVAAKSLRSHPVRDYLRALNWDGTPRLNAMLATHFGAESSLYSEGVGSRWMISAVARVMQPGCQADCTLILESKKQGTGKSTGLEALASPAWFSDSGLSVGDKDSYQSLRAVWIYELGELDAFRGRELTRVKAYLSARSDRYRPSFARRTVDVPRQTVFAGTTNEGQYLTDTTGNRRFLPVKVVGEIDVPAIRRDRDQLWAEAAHRYRQGEAWHVDTPGFRLLCEEQQSERVRADVWEPIIAEWLEAPTVPEYDSDHKVTRHRPVDISAGVLTHEILMGALRARPDQATRAQEMRIATILRSWGWEPGPQLREHGQRVRRYVAPGAA